MSGCSLPGQVPPVSEQECRASLWKLLCSRPDIDSVTLELLVRHYADQSQTVGPVPCGAFNLACSLEMIFGLQRTHLQSRTPNSAWNQPVDSVPNCVARRFPYLLSLKVAKDAFACLSQQAMGYLEMCNGDRDDRTSLRRRVVVRTVVSGTRMLCLRPEIDSGNTSLAPLSLKIGPQFSLWERIFFQTCNSALRKVPDKHQSLQQVGLGGDTIC
jgi:hypothetical protein